MSAGELTRAERRVLELRAAANDVPRTAMILGVTREHVKRLEREGLRKLTPGQLRGVEREAKE